MTHRAFSGAVLTCMLLAVGSAAAATVTSKPGKTSRLPVSGKASQKPVLPAATASKTGDIGLSLLPGSGSKEPIAINAEKMDFFNKDNKLMYSGNVVAVQGESTLKASKLNIDLDRDGPAAATPGHVDAAPAAGNSSVRHMEADGPVTLISKDQVGTGDHATYDKAQNKVHLTGHVTLTQGPNVTQGDDLVYEMPSGHARVSGNVRSLIVPGNGTQGGGARNEADRGTVR